MKKTGFGSCRKFIWVFTLTMAAMCLSVKADVGDIDIDFEGGSFADFKEAFIAAYSSTGLSSVPNIVEINPGDLKNIYVPPMHLREVDFGEIFGVLDSVTEGHLMINHFSGNTVLVEAVFDQESHRLFVYYLDPLMDVYEYNDIFGLMDQAYRATMDITRPNYSLHEETGLLMFSGTPEQIDIAERLLKGLEDAAVSKRQKNHAAELVAAREEAEKSEISDLKKALKDTVTQNKQLEQKIATLEAERENLSELLERMKENIPASDK
ncbi:MAG: hypothetical protein JXR23_06965 [Pontiellaceae bacterium]|nr:hypothetical protein [Pontiellaceae bacterium]